MDIKENIAFWWIGLSMEKTKKQIQSIPHDIKLIKYLDDYSSSRFHKWQDFSVNLKKAKTRPYGSIRIKSYWKYLNQSGIGLATSQEKVWQTVYA